MAGGRRHEAGHSNRCDAGHYFEEGPAQTPLVLGTRSGNKGSHPLFPDLVPRIPLELLCLLWLLSWRRFRQMSVSSRRAFLRFLAASPLLLQQGGLDRASDALDVFDFQTAAQKAIPPAHWGYLMTGVDGEETLKANRDGYARYQLKTRRFVDVSRMDMSVDLFGAKYNSPIVLCPVGSQHAFHRDGEVGAARAAQAKG